MRYLSPAKINLFFRVLSKRSDGYHEIASLMQTIDLCDVLTFSDHPQDLLTCSDPNLLCDESNLVNKALKLFRQYFEMPPVHIHLQKKVPMQAGLGGGSSNAATVLWALNDHVGRRASKQDLSIMAAQLGSDVPFFFSLGTAYCTGRGEKVEPFSISPISGCLMKPPFGLSTPRVYQETRVDELDLIDPIEARDRFRTSHPQYFNDLEPAAFRLEPRLKLLKDQLSNSFSTVTMTGSGSAFFCLRSETAFRSPFISFHSIQRTADCWY